MNQIKAEGLTRGIGIAPGPANGYALDLLLFFDRFGDQVDAAMIVYNPLEPWPGELVLAAAKEKGVSLIARESAPAPGPMAGRANEERGNRMAKVFELAGRRALDGWQLLTAWTVQPEAVVTYAPRILPSATQSVEDTIRALGAALHGSLDHAAEAFAELRQLGENKGRVALKGGTQQYLGKPQAEQWPLDAELATTAACHQLVLDRDYFCANDPRDLRDFGMPVRGVPQAIDRRLYMQLQVVTDVPNREQAVREVQSAGAAAVLYADLNDPRGVGILLWDEDPLRLSAKADELHGLPAFAAGRIRPEFTMLARSYAFGREDDVAYWLTRRPIEVATYPNRPWAVWYPLRRKPGFYRLPKDEQAEMLREHGIIGHNFGSAGYATDIRLECFGMDPADNEFVLGLLSDRLDWLSRLVKEMRSTRQTGEFMDHLGPFFVGHTLYQHAGTHA
jgi:chlorite dismutase